MKTPLLEKLEQALLRKHLLLAQRLQPGLAESQIRDILQQARVVGNIEALLALYTWKNGSPAEGQADTDEGGFLPGQIYQFLDLKTAALEHFGSIDLVGKTLVSYTGDPTGIAEGSNHYFPVFWDGSTGYIAIDLRPSKHNRVMMVEFENEHPFRQAYPSFEAFMQDAIQAIDEDRPLTCFQDEMRDCL